MIATIKGTLTRKETSWIILETGGVGFQIFIPLSTYYKLPDIGENVFLQIATIVREMQISLYGFLTESEKDTFLLLISVSRIGPKVGVSMLSGIDVPDLIQAIQKEDVLTIKSLPGVGLKTAERIILELKNKVTAVSVADGKAGGVPGLARGLYDDVIAALSALGYRKNESDKAIRRAIKQEGEQAKMEIILKASLKLLAKRD